MHGKKNLKKALSILLIGGIMLSYVAAPAYAAAEDGLCEHHQAHSEAVCGYVAGAEGADCTHVHETEVCGYVEEVQEVQCACEETDEGGALIHIGDCGYVAPVTGTPCSHVHDETCGYVEAVEAKECAYAVNGCADCVDADHDDEGGDEPVCTCESDDPARHAVFCTLYEAPEVPVCSCYLACTEENLNMWCDVCGVQGAEACEGEGDDAAYADITVTFVDHDGTERIETVTDGTLTYSADSYNPSFREGYRFEGWYESEDEGVTLSGEAVDLDELVVTASIALYAKWVRAYNLFIGGVQVTEDNQDDVLEDGKVSYDPDENVLTLNGATIEGSTQNLDRTEGAGIYYFSAEESTTLTLKLVGKNRVTALSSTQVSPTAIKITTADMTITGSGDLDASATAPAFEEDGQEGCYGILLLGFGYDLTLNGTGTISATADTKGTGNYNAAIQTSGDVIINSGTIYAKANYGTGTVTDMSAGIYTDNNGGKIEINGGTIYAYSGSATGNTCAIGGTVGANVIIHDGTITAEGGDSSDRNSYGIGAAHAGDEGGKVTITGGTITATGGNGGEGGYGIGAEGGVEITGGTIIANGHTHGIGAGYYDGTNEAYVGTVSIAKATVSAEGGVYGIGALGGIQLEDRAHVTAVGKTYGLATEGKVSFDNSVNVEASSDNRAVGAAEATELEAGDYRLTVVDNAGNKTNPTSITNSQWKTLTYFKMRQLRTVTCVADGETVDTQTVEHGEKAVQPEEPVLEGYAFDKWYSDEDCTEVYDFDAAVTKDVTLYAGWTEKTYTVTYVADGVTVDTQTVEHGESAETPEIPSKTGYDQTDPVWDADGKNITEDTTITAIYTINTYTVNLKVDGETVDTQEVKHGEKVKKPKEPVREGYTVGGWYSDEELTTVFDFDTPITEDIALYVNWVKNTYTVTYVVDGETVDTQTVEHGENAEAPEVPEKEGYTGKWDVDGKNITADITITAVYTKDSVPGDSNPDDSKPGDSDSEGSNPDDSKPGDSDSEGSNPDDSKPGDSDSNDSKPGDSKPENQTPEEPKPSEPASGDTDTPETGDDSNVVLWFGVLCAAAFGAVALLADRKRKHIAK